MKILHAVEYYHPSLGGAQEIVRRISEYLVKLGHEVTIATTRMPDRTFSNYHGVKIEQFAVKGNWAKGLIGETERYQKFVIAGGFDIVMTYAAQQWTTDALLPILHKISAKKIFVPCGFSGLHRPEFNEYFKRMPEWLNKFDHLIFLSNTYQDILFAKKNNCTHLSVIPNGAAEEEFEYSHKHFRGDYHIPEERFFLLTVGGHTGVKGHSFAMRAFSKAKIYNATLVIIGNTPLGDGCKNRCKLFASAFNHFPSNKRRKKNILLLDPPRQEVVAAFTAANLFIFASNIEASPLVLFEAMASGVPFLTLDVGNSAEIIDWSQGGMLAQTRKKKNGYSYGNLNDFTKRLEALYNDPNLRKRLGYAGRAAWERSFRIKHIGQAYENLYLNLLNSHASS